MQSLPTDYYVYFHVDPRTQEVVYVGQGKNERAWKFAEHGARHGDHKTFLQGLYSKGFMPSDWVVIHRNHLTNTEARLLESQLIAEHSPKYNHTFNQGIQAEKKVGRHGEGLCEFAYLLHKSGYGYQRIAFLLGADAPKNNVMSMKRIIQAYARTSN